ncbi:hypothetical protein PSPO01_10997 [Paraphaeosphaeria sporulosa]
MHKFDNILNHIHNLLPPNPVQPNSAQPALHDKRSGDNTCRKPLPLPSEAARHAVI